MESACIYCGQPATTKDHVPPRGLFPRWIRERAQLITVPSCKNCNESSALDDEYFRTALVANIDASPAAMQVWTDEVRPAFQRPQFQGLKKLLRRSLKPVSIAAGGQVIETASFAPDMQRLDRVVRRIVRGLYYHHSGVRIPESHKLTTTFAPDDLLKSHALASNIELNVVDEHVFTYRWLILDDESAWWLLFYGTTLVVGLTTPPEEPTE